MNDCGAKSKLSAPLIDLSKTGNYSFNMDDNEKTLYARRKIDVIVVWQHSKPLFA
jgi:hypothetical protein